MNTKNKTQAPSAGANRIALSKIVIRDDLRVRHGNLSEHHVNDLRQAMKRGSKLPPLLVWQEIDGDGNPTGRFVLLDGRHRLAALRKEKQGLAEISATVLHGTQQEAHLAAIGRNSRTALPLTPAERIDGAWAIVRMDTTRTPMSRSMIARECGVGEATVSRMRRRWTAWPDDSPPPSGNWRRDRQDVQGEEEVAGSASQREQETQRLAKEVAKVFGKLPSYDIELTAEAIARAFGWHLPYLLDYLQGDPGEGDRPWTGLEGERDPNTPPEFDPEMDF